MRKSEHNGWKETTRTSSDICLRFNNGRVLSGQNVAVHTNVLGVRNVDMVLKTVVRISQTKLTQILKVTMTPPKQETDKLQ